MAAECEYKVYCIKFTLCVQTVQFFKTAIAPVRKTSGCEKPSSPLYFAQFLATVLIRTFEINNWFYFPTKYNLNTMNELYKKHDE